MNIDKFGRITSLKSKSSSIQEIEKLKRAIILLKSEIDDITKKVNNEIGNMLDQINITSKMIERELHDKQLILEQLDDLKKEFISRFLSSSLHETRTHVDQDSDQTTIVETVLTNNK